MNRRGDELAIRRILVALDASHHSLAALEAAAELAASLQAELEGLFVEDINLLQAANLPVSQEVRFPFDATAALDVARLERELRVQAEQARQALLAACRTRQVKGSFRVLRGQVAAQVLEAAAEADLLTIGRVSRPLIRSTQLGSTARTVATQARGSVLLVRRGSQIRPPVVVFHHSGETAQRTLLMAAHLAQSTGGYLTVLLPACQAERARLLRRQVADWLKGEHLFVRYQQLGDTGVMTLAEAARAEKGGIFVIAGAVLPDETLEALIENIECPVLLVR